MADRHFNVVKYDNNMADRNFSGGGVLWHSVDEAAFRLGGQPFRSPGGIFRRLPELPEGAIPEAVDMLAWHTAGTTLAFKTDSDRICLRAKLQYFTLVDHMTATGGAGFDLYVGGPSGRRFCTVTRFPPCDREYSLVLLENMPATGMREFLLNFPLYSGIENVEIGLAPEAKIAAPSPWSDHKKIVFYGTSITQGGCASRPGACCTAILSRRWNREVVNLGFSGSGCGEASVVELVAQVPDPGLIVLDYARNTTLPGFQKSLPRAVDIIRRRHPSVPIAMITPLHDSREKLFNPRRVAEMSGMCEAMKFEAGRRAESGDSNVHFIDGTICEPGWDEYFVDGLHPTDLGFSRLAAMIAPQLERLL